MSYDIKKFKMPRYRELPKVGLYLDQVITYMNDVLSPIELSITASMISNYVKQGYIDNPKKKQYSEDQIAYLFFAVMAKHVMSMDNIKTLFDLQVETYSLDVAYDYFSSQLEEILEFMFREDKETLVISNDYPFGKRTLQSAIVAIAQIIYLNSCLKDITETSE